MPVYTVENQQGRVVKFDWRGEVEPTEDDIDEIFSSVIGKPTMYEGWLKKYGIQNPDDPKHHYDYRGAYKAGAKPIQWKDLPGEDKAEDLRQVGAGLRQPIPEDAYMFPDEFKLAGHEIPADISGFQKARNVLEAPGKGVLNFIASSPQWIGGLIKEHGERAEETPDFWDWALTPQMAVGKALKAYQAERTNTDEKIASFGDTMIKRNLEFIKDRPVLQPEEGKLNEFMFSLGSGAGSLAGAIGLSLLTKSPHVAAMAFGTMAKGITYQRAREAGKSERVAGRLSTAHGFGEAALESLGLRLIFGKYAGKLIPSMITEGVQEMSQEIWGNVVAKLGIDEAQKIMENVGTSGLIGFILGGGASIVTGAVQNTESGQMLAESGADIGKIVTRMEETLLPQLQEIMESESGQLLISPEGEGVKITLPTKVKDVVIDMSKIARLSEENPHYKSEDEAYNSLTITREFTSSDQENLSWLGKKYGYRKVANMQKALFDDMVDKYKTAPGIEESRTLFTHLSAQKTAEFFKKPTPTTPAKAVAKPEVEVTPEEIEESTRLMEAEAIAEISHELELSPSSNLFLAIKNSGGIRFYEGMVMKEEMQGVPAYLFDKEGLPPDELRDSLKQFGWEFESEGEMLESIRTIAQEKGITVVSGMPKVRKDVKAIASQLKAMTKAHNVKVKDLLATVRKLGKKLEKPLPKAKVKGVVREATGLTKDHITLPELDLLATQIKAEARQARLTKKSLKDVQTKAINYIKTFVPLKERGKLLVSLREATDFDKTLDNILAKADRLAMQSGRRSAINFLKTEIKNVKTVIKRGRVKGKATIAWEAQDRLRIIIDGLTSYKPGGRRQQATELAAKFYHDHPNEAMPAELKSRISDLSKSNISEMNTEEIVQLAKDIKSIRVIGKTALEAKEGLRQMKLAEIREALARSILKHSVHKKALEKEVSEKSPIFDKKKGLKQRIFEGLNKATAELKQPHFITHMLDGYKALGPTYRYLTYPTDKASQNEEEIKVRVEERIKNILTPLGKGASKFLNQMVKVGDETLERYKTWAVYANSKNPSNRATLTEDWGLRLSEEMVDDIVVKMSAQERNMVDRIKKEVVEELYPETIRVTREYCGITPATVEDYWPIISDRELNDRSLMRDIEKDLLADVWKKTNMDLGSVKDRVGHSGPPDLNFFKVLKIHTDSVIHFNTHALAVRDVQEMLFDPQVKAAVTNSVGEGGYKALKSSLSAIANPRHTPKDWFEHMIGRARRNTTSVMLGLKISVSLLQSGSIFQTIYRTGLRNTLWGIKTYWKNPRMADRFIYEHSLEQKNRGQHFDRELANLVDSDVDFVKRLTQGLPGGKNLLFQFIHGVDHITTMPSWLAGMKKAERENAEDIFTYADDIVQKTQPMGRIKNYSAIMRGGEFQRLFTMFYTFFSSAYNNMADASGKLRYRVDTAEGSKIKETTMAFGEFSRAYLWLLIMPALYAAMMRRPRKMKDKEYLLKSIASYALGTIPFVRDIGNAVINPQFDYMGSPVFAGGKAVQRLITGKKMATKVKAGVMLGGYFTGFPSSQAIITVSGAIDLMEGNTDNPLRLFLSEWTVEDKEKAKGAKLLTPKELRKTYKSKSIEQLRKEMMGKMK